MATREVIESEIDEAIIKAAKTEEIAVLVVGDPFGCAMSPRIEVDLLTVGGQCHHSLGHYSARARAPSARASGPQRLHYERSW